MDNNDERIAQLQERATEAAYINDVDTLRELLPLDSIDWSSIFAIACEYNNVEVVALLLNDKRVRHDLVELDGLMIACAHENLDVTQFLLNQPCVNVEGQLLTGEDYCEDSVSPLIIELLLNNLHNPRINQKMLFEVIHNSDFYHYGEYQYVLANKIEQLDEEKKMTTDINRLKQINKERRLLKAPSLARDEAQICSAILFKEGNLFGRLPTDMMHVVNAFL